MSHVNEGVSVKDSVLSGRRRVGKFVAWLPRAEEELLLLLLRSANGIFDLEMPLLPSAVRGTMVALRVYDVQPSVH